MTDPIVVAHELTKRFGSKTALDHVTVSAGIGDIVGVLGKNGAGKTTLLETLLGFSAPTTGKAALFGTPSVRLSDANKKRIGYVPQRDELVDIMTPRQHLDITAAFRDNWDAALVDRLVAEWEIPLTTRIMKMSVGERQKLSVVQALAHRPELLVLDEPVASLDPIARRSAPPI
jgi:ABC-2 type transport system ATP-binding protein